MLYVFVGIELFMYFIRVLRLCIYDDPRCISMGRHIHKCQVIYISRPTWALMYMTTHRYASGVVIYISRLPSLAYSLKFLQLPCFFFFVKKWMENNMLLI